jgi:hypothetical protein
LTVEAARNQAGEEPAVDYLKKLLSSRMKKRRHASDALILFEEWGLHGQLETPRQQRHIRDDLWEVKTDALRFPYYEVTDATHRFTRLTHGFEKDFGRTVEGKMPRGQIDRGLWMIKEDRAC